MNRIIYMKQFVLDNSKKNALFIELFIILYFLFETYTSHIHNV